MKKNNIISDWLDKHGDPEIDKQVEIERLSVKNRFNVFYTLLYLVKKLFYKLKIQI